MIPFIRAWGRVGVALILFAALLGVALFLNEVLFPFVLACFLAYVLAPLIDHMHRWRVRGWVLPRGLSVLLLYVVILGLLITGGSYLIPNLSREISVMLHEVPQKFSHLSKEWIPKLNTMLNNWADWIPKEEPPVEVAAKEDEVADESPQEAQPGDTSEWAKLLDQYRFEVHTLDNGTVEITPKHRALNTCGKANVDLNKQLTSMIQHATERLKENIVNFLNLGRQFLGKVLGSIWTLFLTLMVSAFILVDVERVIRFPRSLLPPHYHEDYERFLHKLDQGLNGVVRGQLIICSINGTLTAIGLFFLGVPFVISLAILATICSLIPIFGTFLSSFPIVLMALTVSVPTALLAVCWILFIHFLEGNFLNPKIIGTAAEIHPALVVFSLVSGEYVAGIAGALLAVPVFSILQTTFLFLKSAIDEMEVQP